jgi:predicted enzyme involved in methoxymalonyl-ACP biosynthesis
MSPNEDEEIRGSGAQSANGDSAFIDTWLMSCRVLKRGVEDLLLEHIVQLAKNWGVERIEAEYIATKKNKMVQNFYEDLGFQKVAETADSKRFELQVNEELQPRRHFIKSNTGKTTSEVKI